MYPIFIIIMSKKTVNIAVIIAILMNPMIFKPKDRLFQGLYQLVF